MRSLIPNRMTRQLAEHVASALLPPPRPGAETERGTLDGVGHIVLQDYLEHVAGAAVGEAAIVAAAASAHRAEAFEACRTVVERVKAELPIWKREILADGSHTWVGIA